MRAMDARGDAGRRRQGQGHGGGRNCPATPVSRRGAAERRQRQKWTNRPTLEVRSLEYQVVPRETPMSSCAFDDAAYDAPAATCAVLLSITLLNASFSPDSST